MFSIKKLCKNCVQPVVKNVRSLWASIPNRTTFPLPDDAPTERRVHNLTYIPHFTYRVITGLSTAIYCSVNLLFDHFSTISPRLITTITIYT